MMRRSQRTRQKLLIYPGWFTCNILQSRSRSMADLWTYSGARGPPNTEIGNFSMREQAPIHPRGGKVYQQIQIYWSRMDQRSIISIMDVDAQTCCPSSGGLNQLSMSLAIFMQAEVLWDVVGHHGKQRGKGLCGFGMDGGDGLHWAAYGWMWPSKASLITTKGMNRHCSWTQRLLGGLGIKRYVIQFQSQYRFSCRISMVTDCDCKCMVSLDHRPASKYSS